MSNLIQKPFLPSDRRGDAARTRAAALIPRLGVAHLLAHERQQRLADAIRENFSTDRSSLDYLMTRAAATPTSMSSASDLATTALPDFVFTLGGPSAGGQVLRRCLSFEYQNAAAIYVPIIVASASGSAFVGELAPIPAKQFSFDDGVTLQPKKFATITAFTREMLAASVPNIETLVRLLLTENVGLALDAQLFSADAGDATKPPGLLLGLSGLTPSATTPPSEALREDVRDLVAAVAAVAGNAPVLFVASPAQAVALRLWLGSNPIFDVFSSGALSVGTVLCIATNCVCSALDPAPIFDVSREAVLHLEDTSPAEISTGTGPTIATPVTSVFQADLIALKLRMQIAWGLRSASGVSFMQSVTW